MPLLRPLLPCLLALLPLAAPCAAAAPAAPAAAPRQVLPGGVVPLHYDVDIRPDAAALRFSGEVRIAIEVARPVHEITLNAAELDIDSAAVDGQAAAAIRPDPALERVTFAFAQPVAAGRHELRIAWRGIIRTQAQGLFALDFDVGGSARRALYTQFEAADARRFLPCWDEPALKATWTLGATVPQGELALSNMPVADTQPAGAGLEHVRFAETPRMSSYLLFFASGDFERVHREVDGVDLGVVVPRGLAAKAGYALEVEAQLLPYYNQYFGVRYPLPKLDLVAGPGSNTFFGAMENWGAIFSFQDLLLVDERLSTESDRRAVYTTTAHEMAHQWFGDLVTMQWWDGIWLNEGFATWMENKSTAHFHPDWQMWSEAMGGTQRAMRTDAAQGTHAVITDIPDVLAANEAFDAITYQKGAAVIRMLERTAGEDVFRAGVRRYMRAHAYDNSVTDGLWGALEAEGAHGLTRVAHAFTLQPGVPLVTIAEAGCEAGWQRARLEPGRFASDDSGAAGGRWPIPLRLRALEGGAEVAVTVPPGKALSARVHGCGALLANPGQGSYLRVRYAGAAREALLAHYAQLAPEDQLGTYGDTAALALAGRMPLDAVFDLAGRLPADADPLVWEGVPSTLVRLDGVLAGLPARAALRARIYALLAPVAARYGWQPRAGEGANVPLAREALLGVLARLGEPATVAQARERFQRWLAQRDALDAGQRDIVLQAVARNADAATWERLLQLARETQDPQEAERYWYLLGQASDPALAQRALELAMGEQVPRTYRAPLVTAVSALHPELATRFAIDHWDAIAQLVDLSARAGFVAALASASADAATADALAGYAREHVPPSAGSSVRKALAIMRQNRELRARAGELTAHGPRAGQDQG